MNEFFDLIRTRPIEAFWLGVTLLIALGIICSCISNIVRYIVQAFSGIPPVVMVSCPYRCEREHVDEDEEDE